MARFEKVTENPETGWSDRIFPIMKGYKMACCDCGLVHDLKFEIHEVSRTRKDGTFTSKKVSKKTLRVALKARRNNRSTGQIRRNK